MSTNPLIGTIGMFAGNFAPRGWAFCNGQLLPISENQALFSILGTTYGGDGRRSFALPDMRGRSPMHAGDGPGLTPRRLGQRIGSETNTLTVNQLPSHSHSLPATEQPNGNGTTNVVVVGKDDRPTTTVMTQSTGANQSVNNIQPCLAVNFCIALIGIFPSRNR
ncbi:MAG: tail fiber protein [Bacteroidota bacterium]